LVASFIAISSSDDDRLQFFAPKLVGCDDEHTWALFARCIDDFEIAAFHGLPEREP